MAKRKAAAEHRLIPHSRLELVDYGHLFLLTNEEAAARTTLRFLREEDSLCDVAGGDASGRASIACAD